MIAKTTSYLLLVVVGLVAGAAVNAGAEPMVDLASLDDWDIVLAEDATEAEAYAAEEFQKYYHQASCVKLPIERDAAGPKHHVYIGAGQEMQASPVGFSVGEFGDEDLRIVVRDGNVAIAGGRPRGTLYGVYTFLEDYLGVRFLTADHTHVPAIGPSCPIGPIDRFYHPPLDFRWTFYKVNFDSPEFATKLRINTLPGRHKRTWEYPGIPKLGGKTGITLAGHSFRQQIPPKQHADEHPEYYALYKGERLAELRPGDDTTYNFSGGFVYGMQPCLTHPDVLRIVTESVIEDAKAHPEIESFSVSQDDGGAFCQCPNCAAIIEKEGMSGYVLDFVNKVADALAKECPGKMVSTMAYSDTLAPPKSIKARPNVQIWYSTINTCVIHHLDDPDCRERKKYIDNAYYSACLRKWNEICDHLYVWDYIANFEYTNYQLPVANFESMEYKTRYLITNGVKGIFMQATASSYNNEFQDLRNYVASRLLWDPERSSRELMKEFLDLHLGQSGRPILEWINHIRRRSVASGAHCRCVGGNWSDYGLDHDDARKGVEAFKAAMELAQDDTIKSRVEKMSLCAYRAAIEPVWYLKEEDKASLSTELLSEMRPFARRFFELCDKYDVKRSGEGSSRTIAGARERLSTLLGGL